MGLIEEVSRMQQQGMSNQEISVSLQNQGVDKKKISDILSQTAIKNAVSSSQDSPATIDEYSKDSGMEESVMNNNYVQDPPKEEYQEYQEFSEPQAYSQPPKEQKENYSSYESAYQNSDNVTEIAQAIFEEQITTITKKIESMMDINLLF